MDCHKIYNWNTKDCCRSCHEDEYIGYDGIFIKQDDEELEVCCAVANWLEDGKTPVKRNQEAIEKIRKRRVKS